MAGINEFTVMTKNAGMTGTTEYTRMLGITEYNRLTTTTEDYRNDRNN